VVLAVIAADQHDPDQATTLLAEADRLRADSGAEVPWFQQDDLDRARKAVSGS
jgi:hypothetical protein